AGYVSIQAAVGGDPESSTYVEMTVRGDLTRCASLVRQASVQAGGMVAVARNPVSAGYARKCGAVGAIRQAIRLGEAMSVAKPLGGLAVAESAARFLGGRVLGPVKVSSLHLTAAGGFDLGKADLIDLGEARSSEEALLELTFLNEYMTLEKGGKRLATFPDLLTTLETKSGTPLSSAELQEGQELFLLVVPKKNLILGSSLRNRNLYSVLEEATGKEIVRFLS
ncbi:MAG: DUF917 family protein, partial [Firmicutes bacterium]|nr:DUF917 family protein [Bacillota bacterium]